MISNADITPAILQKNLSEDLAACLLKPKFALNEKAKNLQEADIHDRIEALRQRIGKELPYRRLFNGTPYPEHAPALDAQMEKLVDAYVDYAAHFIVAQSRVQLDEMIPGAGKQRKPPHALLNEFMPRGSYARDFNDTLSNALLGEMTKTYYCMEALQPLTSRGVLLGTELASGSRIALSEALELAKQQVEQFRENLHQAGSYVPDVRANEPPKGTEEKSFVSGEEVAKWAAKPAARNPAVFKIGTEPTRGDNPKGQWRR